MQDMSFIFVWLHKRLKYISANVLEKYFIN